MFFSPFKKLICLSVHSLVLRKVLGAVLTKMCFTFVNSLPSFFDERVDKKIVLFISFDVDGPMDSEAIPGICIQLDCYNLPCNWAIVGSLIEKSPTSYKVIIERDDEIINHGYSPHIALGHDNEYHSSMTYDILSFREIEFEVEKNQETILRYLNKRPIGFRTPHFGTFQKKEHLMRLYEILSKNGIKYSSSTYSLLHRVYNLDTNPFGIIEFPFSTNLGSTMSLFDSWGYLEAPTRRKRRKQFFPDFKKIIDTATYAQNRIFLNFYFDPSHVVDFDDFYKCLEYINLHREHIWVGRYSDLLSH